jgi:uncharacterized membrane protein
MHRIMKLRLGLAILALAPLAPPLLERSHPMTALLMRDFFSRLCHQNPARSFMVEGSPVAVCVRCLGIYCGAAVGGFLRPGRILAGRLLGLAMLLTVMDVAGGMLHWHGDLPAVRFGLGLLLGVGASALLFLRPDQCTFSPLGRLSGPR